MHIWAAYMQPWSSFGGFGKPWYLLAGRYSDQLCRIPFVLHNFTIYTLMLRTMANFAVQVDLRTDRDTYNVILLVLNVLLDSKGLLAVLRQGVYHSAATLLIGRYRGKVFGGAGHQ